MSRIQIPQTLIEQIHAAGVTGMGVDDFVQQAVREKLESESRRSDFEKEDDPGIAQAIDDFDSICDKATVLAPGNHLTRDQLHERD